MTIIRLRHSKNCDLQHTRLEAKMKQIMNPYKAIQQTFSKAKALNFDVWQQTENEPIEAINNNFQRQSCKNVDISTLILNRQVCFSAKLIWKF